MRVKEHLQCLELARDKMLHCCCLGLRISDVDRMEPEHIHIQQGFVNIYSNKTGALCLIPFLEDHVFKPVALVAK